MSDVEPEEETEDEAEAEAGEGEEEQTAELPPDYLDPKPRDPTGR